VISGDRGGQGVRPSLQIHLFGNVTPKNRWTSEPQCGGAPSCWKIIHSWNCSELQCKVPTCPGSFLVINVCNRGKNLCSLCIILGIVQKAVVCYTIVRTLQLTPTNQCTVHCMAAQSCFVWHAISAGFAWGAFVHTRTKLGISGESKNMGNWFCELLKDYRKGRE
jgi:hypothetical protein